ncbi:MAG: CotH kinase family protein [Muribaculaceae bacterium]|nr:CotH kinase family protein [Muribaculaceae bacterium]
MPQSSQRMIGMGEQADSMAFDDIKSLGLQVIDINTVDGEWPTCDYVRAPTGAWGKSITNVTRVPGRLRIWRDGALAYDSGDFMADQSGITLRIRGNSSAYAKKKPYKIDLQEKADLLLRYNPNFRDKDWLLIRDIDFRNMQGFELNRLLGMAWTPAYRYVNVVINEEYQGVYMLIESVKRNNNCRLKLSKSGFVFEYDAYWWNDKTYIPSANMSTMGYTFKYPKDNDLSEDDLDYMRQLIADYEASIYDGTYDQLIDVPSFAAWCLGQDILASYDSGGTNQFFLKNDRQPTSLISMPLMWDFDSNEGNVNGWSRCHHQWFTPYFNNTNRVFVKEYVRKWHEVRDSLVAKMERTFQAFRIHGDGPGMLKSLPLDNLRWNGTHLILSALDKRAAWFSKRFTWLDRAIGSMIPTGDANMDTRVDVMDVNLLVNMILELTPRDLQADVNGDGRVDIDDVNRVISIILAGTPPQPADEIAVMPTALTLAAEGDSATVFVEANGAWAVNTDDVPEWLTLTPTSGVAGAHELLLRAAPALQERVAVLHFRCGEAADSLTITQLAPEPGDTVAASIADFLAGNVPGESVRLAGVVVDIDSVQAGRFTLRDWSGTVMVSDAAGLSQFNALAVGDIATIRGHRAANDDVRLLVADEFVGLISVSPVTIAGCDSLPDSDNAYCMVTGIISEVLDAELGELLLTDGDGHAIHIAATMPGWGATADNRLGLITALGLAAGDTITVIGAKCTIDGVTQLRNTFYFSHQKSQ